MEACGMPKLAHRMRFTRLTFCFRWVHVVHAPLPSRPAVSRTCAGKTLETIPWQNTSAANKYPTQVAYGSGRAVEPEPNKVARAHTSAWDAQGAAAAGVRS